MKKYHNAKKQDLSKTNSENLQQVSISQLIDFILHENIKTNKSGVKNIFLEKKISQYRSKYFPKIFSMTKFITKTKSNYTKNLKFQGKYLNSFLYTFVFFVEENIKLKGKLNLLLKHFLLFLQKLYKELIIDDATLIILIKFIVHLSFYDRDSFYVPKNSETLPKLKLIKNYHIFKYSIYIVKAINQFNVTKEYINFLNEELIDYKPNLFIITKKVDMLELINLNDKKDFILDFLAKLYSFKYSKSFLDVFTKQILEVYDIKNNDKNTVNVLKYLNRDLALLNLMQKKEKKKYEEDPFLASHGFVFNNTDKSFVVLKEIIIKDHFTMFFSFCYSPNDPKNAVNKNRIPIVDFMKEDQGYNEISGFGFYIRENYLYHRKYGSAEEMKLCEVITDQTYLCYYTIKEHDNFIINIKTTSDLHTGGLYVKENFKSLLKNKLRMQVGRFLKNPNQPISYFDGYIGPIIMFRNYFPDLRKIVFGLKGSYEKILYFTEYNSKFIDKYDKDMNCFFFNDPKDSNNSFLESKNAFINSKIDIKENLIYYLTPIYEGSLLKKKDFTHNTLKECKINFGINPRLENGSIFFFKNVFTPFEFLKYEGINFLILILELIVSNIDNIKKNNENDRIIMLNIFSELIPFFQDLIYLLNVNYYEDEIRHLLFALEKCVNKICSKFKMSNEIGYHLNNWIRSLTAQDSVYLSSYIKIRNEITKFLLDKQLYDINEYSCIEFFFRALNYCICKRPEGLLNMETLRKIMSFMTIFESVTKDKKIRKLKQFKSFRNEMVKILITFLRKSDFIAPYLYLYQNISDNKRYNYRKYQLVKIFYLESKYYFDNIRTAKGYILTWKYFILFFNYLQSSDSFPEITQNQANVLMAICLRIIIEYPVIGDFFKDYLYKNRKSDLSSKKRLKSLKDTIEFSSPNTNGPDISPNPIDRKKMKQIKRVSVDILGKIDVKVLNELKDKKLKNNTTKRSNSLDKVFKYKIQKAGIIVTNIETNKNEIRRKNSVDFQKKNESNQNIDDFFLYSDFFCFKSLMDIIEIKYKINDFTFRALLLLILEANNNVVVSQEVRLKFITKVKKYEHLKNKDYAPFLKFSYINRETKAQLIQLVNIVDKNHDNITHITYDIFFYLIEKVCENRKEDKCTFNHLIRSKKICTTIFLSALNYNKESYMLIYNNILKLCEKILPYHKKPFIIDFLFEIIITKTTYLRAIGQKLINLLLQITLEDTNNLEFLLYIKFHLVVLFYRAIKSKEFLAFIDDYEFSENGIKFLFNYDLATTKINILKDVPGINKKKCFVEILFEIMLFFCTHSKKEIYHTLMRQMFIMNLKIFPKTNNESKTVLYYIDEIKGPGEKGNTALKLFSKPELNEIPCLSLQLLIKTLKYYYRCEDKNVRSKLSGLATSLYYDAYSMFANHNSKKKKYKNKEIYNFLNEIIKKDVSKKNKETIDQLISTFTKQYSEYLSIKLKKKEKNNKEQKINRSVNNIHIKDLDSLKIEDNDDLNGSFSSCKSSKESKNICSNNQKKCCQTIEKRRNVVKKINKKKDKEMIVSFNEEDENFCNSSIIQTELSMTEEEFTKVNTNIKESKKENRKDSTPNVLFNFNNEKNPFLLDKIETLDKVIIFPKSTLMEQILAIYFTDRLFYNKPFIKMKNYFTYYVKKKHNINITTNNFFNYPIIMKNYISKNLYFGGLFLKHDLDFFTSNCFVISHPYYKDHLKESIQRRIFPKISEQDDINQFIIRDNPQEKKYTFYVDLVTNRNVVFGKITVTKYLVFFQNINREKFLKKKTDEEKLDWLLCSQESDYSNRNKKLYIFKREITEIINRRFLYSFQACEIYLKNGKSYFFNFYSEEKKKEFIKLFNDFDNITIISDLKAEFKYKGFTKQWLNNQITTFAYLLFVNKYSCRSYNDVNQYPVFPWLILYGDKERDLRYTIVAQDEDTRMMLREKYPFSSEHFPYHYTTHYSNASFLIYYLIRINPFTDNQINLQVNKFDVPDRQFNSLDEIQKILYTTKQPREVIPEFFISTEFFYNYNCNYFGVKYNTNILINDLHNKSNFKTPLEFVLNNEVLLESPKFKSQMNYFFDNIYGCGQLTGCEKCNTYDKYSYQEMVNLNQKIKKFREEKLPYKKIKEKITRKSDKIISFGQTPYKLFEDNHPQWKPEKGNKEDELKIDEHFNDMKERFIYFNFDKRNGKQMFYVLVNHEKMSEVKFYNKKIKDDKNVVKTKKRLKLFSKISLDNNSKNTSFVSLYKYNPKFIMINLNFSIFIFGRLKESCFCIFNKSGDSVSYFTESIVICVAKSRKNYFFVGLENGKILEFMFVNFDSTNCSSNVNVNDLQIDLYRSYIAHKKRVSGIYYSELLGLIISSGDDKKIFIRKYYDLSLLTIINIELKFCIDIKINHYYLYILLYNEEKKSHIVEVRSVNGILVAKTDYNLYNNIDFDKEGNLLVGYAVDKKIDVYNPAITQKIKEIDLNQLTLMKKKKKERKEIKIEDDFFLNFIYQSENSSVYCYFSNGNLIQKYMDAPVHSPTVTSPTTPAPTSTPATPAIPASTPAPIN